MEIFTKVRMRILEKLNILQQKGLPEILTEWRRKDMLAGKWLQWLTNSGEVVYGLSEGPDQSGRLVG